MKCPVCEETMREIDRHGVTIDICPGCKGVWLDRGELEKILEMGRREAEAPAPPPPSDPGPRSDREDRGESRRRPERRESFLENIFDMFGGD